MEERKKKIVNSNYGILVILLFAMVCTLTDWIIIERKVRVCECPKCESTSNEVISGNTDNTQVTEKKYNYEDIAGNYYFSMPISKEEFFVDNASYLLTLYSDGTCLYRHIVVATGYYYGNYIIKNNKLYLNFLLSGGGSTPLEYNKISKIININSDGTLLDNNPFWKDRFLIDSVTLTKNNDVLEDNSVDIILQQELNR